ncbi:MAG: hypothetical protein EOT05_03695 [Candidatus Microsaccharimonas sossegonensis]|uniref:Uncharacterized protein n=1 Tax=Candidatus Microsaccharimonas sossegonensis TaxID=2506948 RepID=A0A4Q0AI54_9BACT|nr:MAG: hypothetical protein EOT05_03695 [Candidatus Microsaccharimonas sossegonensis]
MNETVPIHLTSRGEYDVLSPDRIKTQKLARGVIYTLMLAINNDMREAGRLIVELPQVPVFGAGILDGAAFLDVVCMDDDARPVFSLSGVMRMDQLYLEPRHLRLTQDGRTLREGYFLTNEDEGMPALQLDELVGNLNYTRLPL